MAQSLLDQLPTGDRADLARREARIEKFGQFAFIGFLNVVVVAALGLLYVILNRFVFSGNSPLVGILLMAFIVFAMLTLVYVFFREDLKEKRKKAELGDMKGDFVRPAITARLIEEREFEPIPSVTEDTTDLLPTRKRNLH